jgi:hypothetical protein
VSKRSRIIGLTLLLALLAIGAATFAVYRALRHVPEFYREVLDSPADGQKLASDRMLQLCGALASDLGKSGPWHAVFTAREINGWLAVDLVQNYPEALPPEFRDPRVRIEPDRVRLACRFQHGSFFSVLSLTVEPTVVNPNVLAIRIRSARAGAIPVSLSQFLRAISDAARRAKVKIEWRQADGDPVAILSLTPAGGSDKRVLLETLRLGDGKISLAGRTGE